MTLTPIYQRSRAPAWSCVTLTRERQSLRLYVFLCPGEGKEDEHFSRGRMDGEGGELSVLAGTRLAWLLPVLVGVHEMVGVQRSTVA